MKVVRFRNMKKSKLLIFIIFITAVIILADLGMLPVEIFSIIPRYDLFAHFTIYAVMYLTIDTALKDKKIWCFSRKLLTAPVITIVFAVLEEVSQLFLINRTFDGADLFFGIAGSGLFFFFRIRTRYLRIKWIL